MSEGSAPGRGGCWGWFELEGALRSHSPLSWTEKFSGRPEEWSRAAEEEMGSYILKGQED